MWTAYHITSFDLIMILIVVLTSSEKKKKKKKKVQGECYYKKISGHKAVCAN